MILQGSWLSLKRVSNVQRGIGVVLRQEDYVMSDNQGKSLDERLTTLEHGLENLKSGLGLLGIRSCSLCGTFYRRSDAGALCDCGELVCYECILRWWPQ